MSASALPITPEAFEPVLEQLSISQLYAECHRLLNSIYHLRRSNATLLSEDFASDPDCQEAVHENEDVIARQQRRVEMVRVEVERRGFRFTHGEGRGLDLRGEEERRQLSGVGEVDGLIDGANHHGQTGEVESETIGSGGLGSNENEADMLVGNIAIQDNLIIAATNEIGVVSYTTPVAEGVQDGREQRSGNAASIPQLSSMPSVSAQTDDVNGIYL